MERTTARHFSGDAVEYLESAMLMMCDDHCSKESCQVIDDCWVVCARNQALLKVNAFNVDKLFE